MLVGTVMDASTTFGDETQATQIINSVLPQPLPDAQENIQPANYAQKTQDEPSRPELSSSSSQNGGITQYHYFGLASTQTDSQVDGTGIGGGSQKENAHRAGDVPDKSRSNSSVPSHSPDSNKCTAMDAAEDTNGPVPVNTAPRVKTSKKPSKPPTRSTVQNNADPFRAKPVRDTSRPRRRRSPSPASQDSFAGPLPPEEAEKLFVANTTTFNIPLSELRKSNADNVATPQTPSSTRTSAFSFSGIERRVPFPAPPRPLNHTGEILVAETPSNSSRSSNSQGLANQTRSPFIPDSPSIARDMQSSGTQLLDESQPHAQPRDFLFSLADHGNNGIATQPGSPVGSTEPSSSYERVLEADPYAPNTQPLVPTQPASQRTEGTQPIDSTQDAGPSAMSQNHFSYYDPYNDLDRQYPLKSAGRSDATASTAATTPRTVGRGLASLIPKHRRWQYQVADAGPSNMPAPALPNGPSAVAPQAPHARDTQPSDTNAVHGSVATGAQPIQPPPRRRPPSLVVPPEVDVVPDSEPMDVDAAGTDRGSPENSPAKRVSKRVSQLRLDSPVEEIADSVVEDEEDDEEDDDDVPLAMTSDKGKSKVIAKAPRSNASRAKTSAKRPQGRAAPLEPQSSEIPLADVKSLRAKGRAAQYRDASAAPSKASEDTTSTTTTRAVRGRKNGANTVTKGHVPKSRSGTPATALKRRMPSFSDDETAVGKNAELVLPSVHGDGDTEPADDEYMDIDEEEEEAPRSKVRSAKRKRFNSVAPKSAASRAPARSAKASGTPLGSAAKRRKVSSSTLVENESATRVFALWRQDNHYYSGTVHSLVSTSPARYRINFDDGTVDDVDLSKMRLCKLMEGDQVIVPEKQKAVVSRFESGHMVIVEIDNGEELDQVEVEVGDIRIASRTFNSAWSNRTLTVEEVCPIVRPHPLKNSPSPSKMTLGSAASVRTGLLHLRKTGFVVTMSPKHDIAGKTKDKVLAAIKAAGGVIIDDWIDIFSMDGAFSRDSKRWTAKYEDIKCTVRNKNVQQVFLLSDDHNAKPKYLMALALGIPCLDYQWILESAGSGKEEDWQKYLLPAGLCESLDARVSQLVDLDWGNSSEHLREITGNKVPSKVFAGMRILCISPDYVPVPKARRNHADDGAKDSSRMVPRIILAMGASMVEAVPDLKTMSAKLLSEYDYVVVKERGDISRIPPNIKCVPFAWAKDCLIAGRLLPHPDD